MESKKEVQGKKLNMFIIIIFLSTEAQSSRSNPLAPLKGEVSTKYEYDPFKTHNL